MNTYLKMALALTLAVAFALSSAGVVSAAGWKGGANKIENKCDEQGKYWDFCDPCDEFGEVDPECPLP